MSSLILALTFLLIGVKTIEAQKQYQVLQVPGRDSYCSISGTQKAILPSGRFVTPVGNVKTIPAHPFGMAISPNQKFAVTLHNGMLTRIDLQSDSTTIMPQYQSKSESPFKKGSFVGVAFSADSRLIYVSGGDAGTVLVFDIATLRLLKTISIDGTFNSIEYKDSFTGDLICSNGELYILDRANFRVVRWSIAQNKTIASIPCGRQPFGLSISPDKQFLLVANVGVYEYALVPNATQENLNSKMLPFFAFGDNTNQSINGTEVNGIFIPGVGNPNHPDAMSVFVIGLKENAVLKKLKTGLLVGQFIDDMEVVGGASPNSIVVGKSFAYVSNATNDNIAVIDYRNHNVVKHISIAVDTKLDKLRGLLPFGLALSADEKTLYAALLGFNAVAQIDLQSSKTVGLIPTGWGPTRVQLSANGKEIYVASCRGMGAGPNGGKNLVAPPQGTYIGDIQLATFQRIQKPNINTLTKWTQQSLSNTFKSMLLTDSLNCPLPILPGIRQSPIKHIVYITKENRTYDEIFGQLKNGVGDASLARFGVNVPHLLPKELQSKYPNCSVTPNHHQVHKQFAISDNFYCDSDASIHGHHWMLGVIPNEWVEANSSVNKTPMFFSKAPGRRYPGSTGSMDPEDYAEIGGLWEALERKGISFYNFGEANETAHVREEWYDTLTGSAHPVIVPMARALFKNTSHNYAGYNTNIPDQFRANQFEEEFTRMWLNDSVPMPQFVAIQLPNDHTAKERPEDGYPLRHSFVADNDLALGRMLHFLSRTKYWKDLLVIVTEDDPQGGVDHIDAHRSLLMMAGPHVKRGYTSHTHANFGSILKTIYNIFNVPYVNQYDITASLLTDFFTDKPDYSPFYIQKHDNNVFDPELSLKKYNRFFAWRKIASSEGMDNELEIKKEFEPIK